MQRDFPEAEGGGHGVRQAPTRLRPWGFLGLCPSFARKQRGGSQWEEWKMRKGRQASGPLLNLTSKRRKRGLSGEKEVLEPEHVYGMARRSW